MEIAISNITKVNINIKRLTNFELINEFSGTLS